MRRNILLSAVACVLCLLPYFAHADGTELTTAPKVWTVPAVFTADQEVTFYYDVTDVGFAPGVDLYLWAWQPTEPDAGNGGNSSDFAKLEYLGDNIYKKTMVPTEYFKAPLSAFESEDWPGFWQRLKTKGGEFWSGVYQAPDCRQEWKAFEKSGNELQVYSGKKMKALTDKFTLNEPLTIVFNPDLFKVGGVTMTEFAKKAGFGGFKLHSGLNDWTYKQEVKVWIPKCMEKVDIIKLGNGYYSISMTSPYDYYKWNYDDGGSVASTGLQTDTDIENLTWLMVGIINNDWGGTSAAGTLKAGTAAPYPDPVFSVFPTRVSAKDILTLVRQYNERTAGELKYTITAEDKTITGTMPGVRDKRQATVNLLEALNGVAPKELHVVIAKENGQTVVDTLIPLVTPDEE